MRYLSRRSFLAWLGVAASTATACALPTQPTLKSNCRLTGFGEVVDLRGVSHSFGADRLGRIHLYFDYKDEKKSKSLQDLLAYLGEDEDGLNLIFDSDFKSFNIPIERAVTYTNVFVADSYGSFGVVNNRNYYVIELIYEREQ